MAKVPNCIALDETGSIPVKYFEIGTVSDGSAMAIDLVDQHDQSFPLALPRNLLAQLIIGLAQASTLMANAKAKTTGQPIEQPLLANPLAFEKFGGFSVSIEWSPQLQALVLVLGHTGVQIPMSQAPARQIAERMLLVTAAPPEGPKS